MSYTTRPRRKDEFGTHIFVTENEFDQIGLENIVAFTKFNGYRYCATQKQVELNDFYIIDYDGINYFKTFYTGRKKVKVIYIKTTTEVRTVRMKARGDTDESISARLNNDLMSFKDVEQIADYVFVNDDFETCINEIAKVVIDDN